MQDVHDKKIGFELSTEKLTRIIHQKHTNKRMTKSVDRTAISSSKSIKRKSAFDLSHKSNEHTNTRYSPNVIEGKHNYMPLKNKGKNVGVISQLFTAMRKQKSVQSDQSYEKRQGSLDELKKQLRNLNSVKNQMIPASIIRQSSTKSKRRSSCNQISHKSRQKLQTTKLVEVTHKEMKDYSIYIHSESGNYYTQINYNQLRENEKWTAFSKIDINQYKLIESVNLCLIDSLKDDNSHNEKLLREYCIVYFQNEERRKMEVFLNYHIFKAFASKIKSFYTYQRIFYYAAYKLAERKIIYLNKFSIILINALTLIDLSIKSTLQTVKDLMPKSTTNVMETFRSLKIVKEIQKYNDKMEEVFEELSKSINQLDSNTSTNISRFKTQYTQIIGNMKPFLGESNFYHKVEQFQSRSETILNWKLLKIPPIPYLPEKGLQAPKYTLVIGLNQVLIFYNPSTKILKYRPYMDSFLEKVCKFYEIVLFSEFQKQLTDRITKQIEKNEKFFKYCLYRSHLKFYKTKIIKDIRILGRKQQEIVVLDVNSEAIEDCQNNLLPITPFKPIGFKSVNVHKDNALLTSMNQLLTFYEKTPEDIRCLLKKATQLTHIPEMSSLQQRQISISHNNQLNQR